MSEDTAEGGEGAEELDEAAKLSKFKLDITKDADVGEEQRELANEDMRFTHVPGGMWEGWLENDFTPDRVRMEFDVVTNHLQRYLGEWSLNKVGVEFKPDDSKTSDDDAELLNGIYRADFRNFSGSIATDNAVDEAATCGYGAMKLGTFFEDDDDPENDNQRIEFRPIHNAHITVIWDRAAQRIDKRDARRVTELKAFTRDSFLDEWPDEQPVSAYDPQNLRFTNINTPELIYIATRYEVVRQEELVFIYNNLKTRQIEVYNADDHALIVDELKADEFRTFVRERKMVRQTVEKTVFSGDTILKDTKRIVGKWLPIIPFYGVRTFVEGAEYYRGLVRKLKDPARLFNMQVSQLAENSASSGQRVPIFMRNQMENEEIKELWANKENVPYLVVDPATDTDGNIIAAGPIGYSEPGVLDGNAAALLQTTSAFIQDATGGVPQDTLDPDASGKAIQAMMKRENMTTQTITANIANAIMWEGEVYQSMAAQIYNTQRIFRTIGKDGKEGQTQLHETVIDSETGQIIAVNTLRGKKFRSYSDVGPQYETMREQTVEELKGMLDTFIKSGVGAQYTDVMVSVLLQNITGVGLDPIKELNRRIMLAQGTVKPETPEEEQIVAQLQEQAQQPDPNQGLIEAATNQQNAEARSLDASSFQKIADANKKEAETVQILADIRQDQERLGLLARKQIMDEITS